MILGPILGRHKQKETTNIDAAATTRTVVGIANLKGLARIGKRPACGLQHGPPLRGAPDPVALRAIPATVPGMLDCLVEGLIG